jgi:hypothetical protein
MIYLPIEVAAVVVADVVAWVLSFAAGAIGGVDVAADVVMTGEDVAAEFSLAAFGALTITVRVAVPVRPFGSVTA